MRVQLEHAELVEAAPAPADLFGGVVHPAMMPARARAAAALSAPPHGAAHAPRSRRRAARAGHTPQRDEQRLGAERIALEHARHQRVLRQRRHPQVPARLAAQVEHADQRHQRHAEHDHRAELACASLTLLQRIATAISSADSAAAKRQQHGEEPQRLAHAELEQRAPACRCAAATAPGMKLKQLSTAISMRHRRHRAPLAEHERQRRGRVHQQRLERAALALAGGAVQRRVQRAVEHRHQHEEGQHAGDLRARASAGLARSRSSTPHRLEQLAGDAAQRQRQRSALAVEAGQQPLRRGRRRPRRACSRCR